MTKQELINKIAAGTGVGKTSIDQVLNHLGSVTAHELTGGGEITLPGIGKLGVKTRAARTGRNPATGAELKIAAKRVPHFSAAKVLKDAVA